MFEGFGFSGMDKKRDEDEGFNGILYVCYILDGDEVGFYTLLH